MYEFIITYDFLEDKKFDKHIPEETPEYVAKCVYPFRLFDDDGELYFEGRSADSSSFDPLDYFGAAFGCTDIQYLEKGKWESL